jgi:tetratricopeptide (TPR) repeat protein
MFMCAALFLAAGCWRVDNGAYVAEVDEPDYRRAKELLRQGRANEALAAFDKVLSKRGLNNAPETHMDMAIINQQHMRDQLAAIYHYQKYLTLMPNAPRHDVVQQRIEAARREYVSTLPGRPSLDLAGAPADYVETINRLRAQNEQLRAALAAAQATAARLTQGGNAGAPRGTQPGARAVTVENPVVVAAPQSPPQSPPYAPQAGQIVAQPRNQVSNSVTVSQPAGRQPAQVQSQQPQQTQTQPRQQAVRRHTVQLKDTLYSISRQYYGTATNAQVEGIVNANRDVLESRNTPLRAGMVLKIP